MPMIVLEYAMKVRQWAAESNRRFYLYYPAVVVVLFSALLAALGVL